MNLQIMLMVENRCAITFVLMARLLLRDQTQEFYLVGYEKGEINPAGMHHTIGYLIRL